MNPTPRTAIAPRELALCGLLGAAALLLPVLFHVVHLGSVFMPMYIPLVMLAFLVRPMLAATTAGIVPLLSSAMTGMPPLYPPVALFMASELAIMGLVIALACGHWPKAHPGLVLAPVLLIGRLLYVTEVFAFSRMVSLPAAFLAGVSLLSGWPGVVLMLVVIPQAVRVVRHR